MARSFGIVDQQLHEADFFLERLCAAGMDVFAVRCYLSAFLAATRNVTFAMQKAMKGVPGFSEWYAARIEELERDPEARFFKEARNEAKLGISVYAGGSMTHGGGNETVIRHWFSSTEKAQAPEVDVETACRAHMKRIAEIVLDCYDTLAIYIDPHGALTLDAIRTRGMSVEDLEEELGFARGMSTFFAEGEQERLSVL
ncbi:MAG: hypothetical protein JNL44_17600, partial [Gemmatimonadetes bacterium]|nr:hypothetical protein [Gemmatimonadota bacterium]